MCHDFLKKLAAMLKNIPGVQRKTATLEAQVEEGNNNVPNDPTRPELQPIPQTCGTLQYFKTMVAHILTFAEEQNRVLDRYDKVPSSSEVRTLDKGINLMRRDADGLFSTFFAVHQALMDGTQPIYMEGVVVGIQDLMPKLVIMERKMRALTTMLESYNEMQSLIGTSEVVPARIALHKSMVRVKNSHRLKIIRGGFEIGAIEEFPGLM